MGLKLGFGFEGDYMRRELDEHWACCYESAEIDVTLLLLGSPMNCLIGLAIGLLRTGLHRAEVTASIFADALVECIH